MSPALYAILGYASACLFILAGICGYWLLLRNWRKHQDFIHFCGALLCLLLTLVAALASLTTPYIWPFALLAAGACTLTSYLRALPRTGLLAHRRLVGLLTVSLILLLALPLQSLAKGNQQRAQETSRLQAFLSTTSRELTAHTVTLADECTQIASIPSLAEALTTQPQNINPIARSQISLYLLSSILILDSANTVVAWPDKPSNVGTILTESWLQELHINLKIKGIGLLLNTPMIVAGCQIPTTANWLLLGRALTTEISSLSATREVYITASDPQAIIAEYGENHAAAHFAGSAQGERLIITHNSSTVWINSADTSYAFQTQLIEVLPTTPPLQITAIDQLPGGSWYINPQL